MDANKIFLSLRDAKGRMHSVNPFDIQEHLPTEVKAQAETLIAALSMKPKRGRGRPKGYKCSGETVAKMVAGTAKTKAAKRQAEAVARFNANLAH